MTLYRQERQRREDEEEERWRRRRRGCQGASRRHRLCHSSSLSYILLVNIGRVANLKPSCKNFIILYGVSRRRSTDWKFIVVLLWFVKWRRSSLKRDDTLFCLAFKEETEQLFRMINSHQGLSSVCNVYSWTRSKQKSHCRAVDRYTI